MGARAGDWYLMTEEQRDKVRERARLGMARLRRERPKLKWSQDTMTYAIVKAAAKGAGIPLSIIYDAKRARRAPDPRIVTTLVEYSEGLLDINAFRTTIDGKVLEWDEVRSEPRSREA